MINKIDLGRPNHMYVQHPAHLFVSIKRKKMDLLDTRFGLNDRHTLDATSGCEVITAKTEWGHSAVVASVKSITPEAVNSYCDFHRSFMEKFPVYLGKKLVFVYDLRGTEYQEFSETIRPFVNMHTNLKEKYQRCLLCTIIVINSECARHLLNFLISNVFTPSRPVRIMDAKENVCEVIGTLWPKCCRSLTEHVERLPEQIQGSCDPQPSSERL